MKHKKRHLMTGTMILCIFLAACGANADVADQSSEMESSTNASNEKLAGEIGEAYIIEPLREFHDVVIDWALYQDSLYYVSYEKLLADSEEEQVIIARIDLDKPSAIDIIRPDIPPTQRRGIERIAIDNHENIHIMTSLFDENWQADTFWYQIGKEGNIINTTDITGITREHGSSIMTDFMIDADGNAYIAGFYFSDPDYSCSVYAINPAGDLLFQTLTKHIVWSMFKDTEGKIYVHRYTTINAIEGFTTSVISQIDIDAGVLNDTDITGYSAKHLLGLGINAEKSLFYANINGVYDADLENGEITERFTWPSLSFKPSPSGKIHPLSGGRIMLANWPDGMGRLGQCRPVQHHPA